MSVWKLSSGLRVRCRVYIEVYDTYVGDVLVTHNVNLVFTLFPPLTLVVRLISVPSNYLLVSTVNMAIIF